MGAFPNSVSGPEILKKEESQRVEAEFLGPRPQAGTWERVESVRFLFQIKIKFVWTTGCNRRSKT